MNRLYLYNNIFNKIFNKISTTSLVKNYANLVNGKKEKSSSRRKDGRKRGGGVSQVCTAVKFPRSSSVREVEKSILPVCSTAEQEFSPFYCHAHTRLVSNDLTSEGGGENCCSNEAETGNCFFTRVAFLWKARGEESRNVYRLRRRRSHAGSDFLSAVYQPAIDIAL